MLNNTHTIEPLNNLNFEQSIKLFRLISLKFDHLIKIPIRLLTIILVDDDSISLYNLHISGILKQSIFTKLHFYITRVFPTKEEMPDLCDVYIKLINRIM